MEALGRLNTFFVCLSLSLLGLGDLLNAETTEQLRLAHRQNESKKRLEPIRSLLIRLLSRIEAAIDFAEDVETQQNRNWKQDFRNQVSEARQKLAGLITSTRKGMLIRSGIRVALVGKTNVGKSSLMNRLGKQVFNPIVFPTLSKLHSLSASRDVAIVSKIPGTTRDSLEMRTCLANLPVTITDTAGLRQTVDELESEGILRSIKRLVALSPSTQTSGFFRSSEAHIVVFVLSAEELLRGTVEEEMEYLDKIIKLPKFIDRVVCINKSDLLNDQQRRRIMEGECFIECFQFNT